MSAQSLNPALALNQHKTAFDTIIYTTTKCILEKMKMHKQHLEFWKHSVVS